jgi:hypothetical protein
MMTQTRCLWEILIFLDLLKIETGKGGGGNMQDIMVFNEIISNLGLQKVPLKGRNFTWSNMQQDPLLE